jgi:thiol-disulfide isomerase/thioredoxin
VGARLDIRGDPKAFQFEIPQGAKLVQQFVDPLPVPLGKPVAEFEFLALDGQAITPKSLSGKIVVLDFWATWCQPCVKNLPLLQQVYAKYKDNPKVQFVAVSVDKPEVTDQAVREACERIQVSVPIARDTRQQLGQILQTWQVPIPMMLILGADGTLEHQEAGINPNRVAELSDHLDALLAGQSVYQRTLAAFERAMQEPPPPPGVAISEAPLSEAQASPASAPKSLQLTKLWTAPDLQQPGNIYVLPDPAGDRILVVDGWQSIVELSAEGQVLARHTLDLPETSQAAGFLRTAVDGSGKRYYVAGAVGQPQAHLFDSAWKRLLTYPAEPNNSGLFDARLVDLDQNGQPEWAISYIGDLGAEAVTLSGQRLWASRALKDVFCLVPCDNLPAGGRALLFCHSQGSIGSINAQGERGPEIIFDQQFLRLVAAADLDNNGQAEYLGIGLGETGDDILLGLTLDGSVQWTYPMPAGKQHPVLEPIAAGLPRGGRKHWVVAGVDGSIHVLAADGKPVDRFNHGAIVHGLATLERSGQGVLLISSKNGLEAFAVK